MKPTLALLIMLHTYIGCHRWIVDLFAPETVHIINLGYLGRPSRRNPKLQ